MKIYFSHLINKLNCVENAWWENGILRCSRCGRELALRYRLNGETRLYILQPFRKFIYEITAVKDMQDYGTFHYLGDVSFDDFVDLSFAREPIIIEDEPVEDFEIWMDENDFELEELDESKD